MALTSQEQNKVVTLLGYGIKTIQAGSVIYDKVLNDRLHSIPPDGEYLVREWLTQVYAIETQLKQAPTRLAAAKVDNLEMNLRELEMLRSERKKISRELAAYLDIPYQGVGGPNVGVSN